MLFLQYENFELGVKLTWPWTVIILFPFALFMLAEGFYTINKQTDDFSIFGLKWVRNNINVWENTHRTAGKSLILVSILFIVISILNEIFWHTYWIYLIAIGIWLIAYYLFTLLSARAYARKYGSI